eukprot:CAMPEP_0182437614 /NCGR_PEP_ID=MMETSP1167-20130531/85165_1 /TAXON_ID=2988 /ORGANISM="Mallomonas Sp, Strain CCMP3275" /LENGTH=350 /DNA_ID=CAMNT_0024630593 /DNA_START=355 /DNA_END=1408 /DNA_ORIENTATION=-
MGETLGKGGFSVVRVGVEQSTGRKVAVKCTNRSDIQPEDEEAIRQEAEILIDQIIQILPEDEEAIRQEAEILIVLNHPNIVKCYNIYEDDKTFYVILEILKGGELFEKIVKKTFYSESDARDLVQLLLNAIKYFHEKGIVHRDLKPENLLLTSDADDADIKIADFGFAAYDHGRNQLTDQCGTPHYVAPEILRKEPYGSSVDMWAMGIITYVLLGGYPPFHDEDMQRLFKKIKRGEYSFHREYWGAVSEEAKDLIRGLLTIDVTKRFTADQALNHSWVKRDKTDLSKRDLQKNLETFKKNIKLNRLKQAAHAVIATQRIGGVLGKKAAKKLQIVDDEEVFSSEISTATAV